MGSIAFTLVFVVTMAVGVLAQNATPSGSSVTIATINSEPITQADLNRVRREHDTSSLGNVLVDLVDERVVVQRGKNLGYALGDQQYESILENVKRLNGITSDDQLDAALAKDNLTRAQLRSGWEARLIVPRVLATEGLAQVSDEEARRYFDSHLDDFPLQTFESARPNVLARLGSDTTAQHLVFKPYFQSLRNGATIVWTEPDLQQAYEQAAR